MILHGKVMDVASMYFNLISEKSCFFVDLICLIVLGSITKNVNHGIFKNSNGFTVYDGIFFPCIIRCSKHFLLVARGITSPF